MTEHHIIHTAHKTESTTKKLVVIRYPNTNLYKTGDIFANRQAQKGYICTEDKLK